jgi:AcrR family transcriptional regulator
MFTEMKPRKYTLKRRAEDQERTRERIVEAAMQLHGEVGPRSTTISAIAERAGVQRLTVYRHFANDTDLFAACSSRWIGLNPPPQLVEWSEVAEPRMRTEAALLALYGYYGRTREMWARVLRDADLPALRMPLNEFSGYLEAVAEDLAAAWRPKGRRPKALAATLRHAVRFGTWQSLDEQGLAAEAAARLVAGWVEAVR